MSGVVGTDAWEGPGPGWLLLMSTSRYFPTARTGTHGALVADSTVSCAFYIVKGHKTPSKGHSGPPQAITLLMTGTPTLRKVFMGWHMPLAVWKQ